MKFNKWKLLTLGFSVLMIVLAIVNTFSIGFRFTNFNGEHYTPVTLMRMFGGETEDYIEKTGKLLIVTLCLTAPLLLLILPTIILRGRIQFILDCIIIVFTLVILLMFVSISAEFVTTTIKRARIYNDNKTITVRSFFNQGYLALIFLCYIIPSIGVILSAVLTNDSIALKIFKTR